MGIVRRTGLIATLPLLLTGGTTFAGPAPGAKGDDAKETSSDVSVDSREVAAAQQRIESGLSNVGGMAERAKQDGDVGLADCLEDKLATGREIMNIATEEMLVLRSKTSTAQQRSTAAEKLSANADQMDAVVSNAKGCSENPSLEAADDETRNKQDETNQVPLEDPTISPTEPPVPPAVDQSQPPTVASPVR